MLKFFADARVRLVGRAIVAGLFTAIGMVNQADDPFSAGVWKGAIVAGAWAAIELITPLNALLGWWKNPQ